jgi:hypothetical protein
VPSFCRVLVANLAAVAARVIRAVGALGMLTPFCGSLLAKTSVEFGDGAVHTGLLAELPRRDAGQKAVTL